MYPVLVNALKEYYAIPTCIDKGLRYYARCSTLQMRFYKAEVLLFWGIWEYVIWDLCRD